MKSFLQGFTYHAKGLSLAFRRPRLLFWGILRLAVVLLLTVAASALILVYHQEILNAVWTRPESRWILWLWVLLSWLMSLFLMGVAAVLSYLVAQIVFAVLVMDYMSRITEKIVTGHVEEPGGGLLKVLIYLIGQEIPRAVLPVAGSLILMVFGWLLPFGPLWVLLSSGAAVCFLAWDNTDLVPARRLLPFGERFGLFKKNLLFHLGFGLPFLVPAVNIFLLSFAPVGATLYALDRMGKARGTGDGAA